MPVSEKNVCGKCSIVINDIEPVRCGCCEMFFHTNPECCGFNPRANKELFLSGIAMYFCCACRNLLKGRSIQAYVKDLQSTPPNPAPSQDVAILSVQVKELTSIVASLSSKVEQFMSIRSTNLIPRPQLSYNDWVKSNTTPSSKRRRSDHDGDEVPAQLANVGTKVIAIDDLTIAEIVATPPPPRFWLYLAGFNPKILNVDVGKIVSRCLDLAAPPGEIFRLVPKDKNTSRYSFVSFKVGLNPSLKDKALRDVWPRGISYREFVDFSKNDSSRRSGPNVDTLEDISANIQATMIGDMQ